MLYWINWFTQSQYDDRTKRAGESFDQKKEDLTKSLDKVKDCLLYTSDAADE